MDLVTIYLDSGSGFV